MAPLLIVEVPIQAVTSPVPVSVPSPMRLCASEAPIATAVPSLPANDTLPDTAATSAWIDDVSFAVTLSAPTGEPVVPMVELVMLAVVKVPIRLSASEPPPATPRPLSPPAAIDSAAASEVA